MSIIGQMGPFLWTKRRPANVTFSSHIHPVAYIDISSLTFLFFLLKISSTLFYYTSKKQKIPLHMERDYQIIEGFYSQKSSPKGKAFLLHALSLILCGSVALMILQHESEHCLVLSMRANCNPTKSAQESSDLHGAHYVARYCTKLVFWLLGLSNISQ